MTKAELIERLENLPDDAEVYVDGSDGDMVSIRHIGIYEADKPVFALIEVDD